MITLCLSEIVLEIGHATNWWQRCSNHALSLCLLIFLAKQHGSTGCRCCWRYPPCWHCSSPYHLRRGGHGRCDDLVGAFRSLHRSQCLARSATTSDAPRPRAGGCAPVRAWPERFGKPHLCAAVSPTDRTLRTSWQHCPPPLQFLILTLFTSPERPGQRIGLESVTSHSLAT